MAYIIAFQGTQELRKCFRDQVISLTLMPFSFLRDPRGEVVSVEAAVFCAAFYVLSIRIALPLQTCSEPDRVAVVCQDWPERFTCESQKFIRASCQSFTD